MLITDEEFELRLFTLMKLVRSSIMYLSLAINYDEMNKPDNGIIALPIDVPGINTLKLFLNGYFLLY
jgi:hypothetical protein